jgi:hypothetical protein
VLRILVEIFHIGVGRRTVEIEVVLFDILAVIALAIGESKQALLENGIYPIPQGNRKAQLLSIV